MSFLLAKKSVTRERKTLLAFALQQHRAFPHCYFTVTKAEVLVRHTRTQTYFLQSISPLIECNLLKWGY